jgi:hypothetical protein
MNEPEPRNPKPEISPEELTPQPVTTEDLSKMSADIAAINDKINRIFEVVVEAPARLEAARKAEEVEAVRKLAQAIANGVIQKVRLFDRKTLASPVPARIVPPS